MALDITAVICINSLKTSATNKDKTAKNMHSNRTLFMKLLMLWPFLVLFIGCISKPVLRPSELDKQTIDAKADIFLQRMVREEHFTGVALVLYKGNIVHAKGYKTAKDRQENDVATLFHVASLTKQFTAVAVMQLVDKGQIELKASINSYLPQKYRSPKWDLVTIHHLLSHSSGIPDYGVTRDYYHVVNGFCLGDTVDRMIKEAMAKDLSFTPGTQFSYTNLGYTLLGLIIENQSKIPFDKYLKDNILDPMGMHSSKIHIEGHLPSVNEAVGHRFSKEKNKHVFDDHISLPVTAPDGGLITSLNDFVRWINLYKNKGQKILSQESLTKMTWPATKTGWGGPFGTLDFMGYGLFVKGSIISHMGEIVGFKSYFLYDREQDLLVAVFSNNTTNDPIRIGAGLLKELGYF